MMCGTCGRLSRPDRWCMLPPRQYACVCMVGQRAVEAVGGSKGRAQSVRCRAAGRLESDTPEYPASSYGLYSYGLYSYGLYDYGLYTPPSTPPVVMAYIVMAHYPAGHCRPCLSTYSAHLCLPNAPHTRVDELWPGSTVLQAPCRENCVRRLRHRAKNWQKKMAANAASRPEMILLTRPEIHITYEAQSPEKRSYATLSS